MYGKKIKLCWNRRRKLVKEVWVISSSIICSLQFVNFNPLQKIVVLFAFIANMLSFSEPYLIIYIKFPSFKLKIASFLMLRITQPFSFDTYVKSPQFHS